MFVRYIKSVLDSIYFNFQFEWNMKVWWVHTETLISYLMAYKETRDPDLLEKFGIVFDYCYTKVFDIFGFAYWDEQLD